MNSNKYVALDVHSASIVAKVHNVGIEPLARYFSSPSSAS